MGELDLIKPYIELKGTVFFGRLNMKPGKPTTFGRIGNTLMLALPGNPVSCFVTASLFLLPILSIINSAAVGSVKSENSTIKDRRLSLAVRVASASVKLGSVAS